MADDPCSHFLPDQSKWSHAEKLKLSKVRGYANKTYFDTMYTHLNKLAKDLTLTDARFLYALSSRESGWMNVENTWLNNPFGLTKGGADNLGFDTLDQAVDYWECKYGRYVHGKSKMDFFMDGLKEAHYNSAEEYYAKTKWEQQLHAVDTWSARFGYQQIKKDGLVVLLPASAK